jgi:Uri superfamily endonuclease
VEITYRDDRFCCWGEASQGGVYLLRLTVSQPLAVQFGRFQNGRLFPISPGHYLYVGSALGEKGSSSLARRLLRHASRGDAHIPQPIRQEMVRLFAQIGLGPTPLPPPVAKKLRWHIDFLLEELGVALTAVYFFRSVQPLEKRLARSLLTLPELSPLAVGLGSSDDPGGTHLLRATAVPAWWATFPQQLSCFLQDIVR